MGCYVIAVGGTGNKILESLVYAACADVFGGVSHLDMLSVDVDASCGNTTRAKRAAECYQNVREALKTGAPPHRCFHTAVNVRQWDMNLSRRAASVEKMAQNHSRDRLLARTLFTPAEARLEYSEGFRGHPDLGVLFFADLLSSLEKRRQSGQPDELNAMLDRMEADMQNGREVRVLLCGSIFGGTGASGIPAISKYLRSRFSGDLFTLGGLLMLPYYSVPRADVDESREIAVSSDTFLDKARTALQYYGMDGMIGSGGQDGIYDAVYLLGLPPEFFMPTHLYATGSQAQENDAHLLEWLAARCAVHFLSTRFHGADRHNRDCYYYQWHTPQLSWACFDQDALFYRDRYGAMLKAAVVYLTECYPTLHGGVTAAKRSCLRVNYCAPYFSAPFSARQRALGERRLDSLYRFFALYAQWLRQVLTSLHPDLVGPSDGLFQRESLDILSRLLDGGCADQQACEQLQRRLHQLVAGPLRDSRDIGWVIRGLGGGEGYTGDQIDGAFSAFVSTLMNVVMENP